MGDSARAVAYGVLKRVEHDGAYANLTLGPALDRSRLAPIDKAFATDLVYGTTRMRRACDFAMEAFLMRDPQPELRTLLRLGVYQLLFAGVAPHAAVGETVELAPKQARGFVNAILRRVSTLSPRWPDVATELSYPDWIVDALGESLGPDDAEQALHTMNRPAPVHERADGYIQDLASQWTAELVGARAGELVLDACAAPGGKATWMSGAGADVVAADLRQPRVGLIADNARSTGRALLPLVADATVPPFRDGAFDAVLIDAPCSGLGVLRRRADARWRITAEHVGELAELQQQMINALAPLVRPGGRLVYSVCTLLDAESTAHRFPDGWEALAPPPAPWRELGNGAARLLPQDADTDGMTVIRYARPG